MAQDSKIEWTHHTANLWWGCTKVHEGCNNCYAETLANRFGPEVWGNDKPRRWIGSFFKDLAKFQREAAKANEIHRVFVGSMMDIFEKPMPLVTKNGEPLGDDTGELRKIFFHSISGGQYPNLLFLLLTKRPSNINKYIPESWKEFPPSNVMYGYSPVTQKTFDDGVAQLAQVNGKRFLSVEPQLENIYLGDLGKSIHWIIQGGESGHHKRPFKIEWADSLRTQCEVYGIPYFFKQIDKVQTIPEALLVRQFPS